MTTRYGWMMMSPNTSLADIYQSGYVFLNVLDALSYNLDEHSIMAQVAVYDAVEDYGTDHDMLSNRDIPILFGPRALLWTIDQMTAPLRPIIYDALTHPTDGAVAYALPEHLDIIRDVAQIYQQLDPEHGIVQCAEADFSAIVYVIGNLWYELADGPTRRAVGVAYEAVFNNEWYIEGGRLALHRIVAGVLADASAMRCGDASWYDQRRMTLWRNYGVTVAQALAEAHRLSARTAPVMEMVNHDA